MDLSDWRLLRNYVVAHAVTTNPLFKKKTYLTFLLIRSYRDSETKENTRN